MSVNLAAIQNEFERFKHYPTEANKKRLISLIQRYKGLEKYYTGIYNPAGIVSFMDGSIYKQENYITPPNGNVFTIVNNKPYDGPEYKFQEKGFYFSRVPSSVNRSEYFSSS